ncbi:hypothetical protein LCGC14_0095660 [marine sediment metagenome]|uniref:BFN domain-containing protein n=1 Tax=marine sediment metagenome TaxID=412755 RepID=A0A0F9VUL6_9ZZZZ|nr:bifunctional nuclease family protein [Phycisphaerae bacterium]
MDVPMELARILITEYGDQQMIFLREIGGERAFPILIGINEALAIDRRLKGQTPPRPMTHDLLANVIDQMGGHIERVVINDLRQHTFIATLYVHQNGRTLEIDARPSDAIALGVALKTPIFVAEKVLNDLVKAPQSKEDRLQLLRDRLILLEQTIDQFRQKLADETFRDDAPDEQIEQMEAHLEAAEAEYEAIRQVLDKLG